MCRAVILCGGFRLWSFRWLRPADERTFREGNSPHNGHKDVSTTMIYTHVLNRGGKGVKSPADNLGLQLS
jgi:hypothetical protein